MKLTLYGYWRSSSTWRVRLGLHLKGLDYANVPVHLLEEGGRQRLPEHTDRNAMAQVPVLEIEDAAGVRHLTQSLAILSWLDAVAPSPPLLPADPFQRARAWELAEIVNAGIQPVQNLSVLQAVVALGGDKMAWGRETIAKGLAAMERLAQDTAGGFLVGDAVTIADLCLVPQLYNARRFQVDLSAFPTLLRVESHCDRIPAFKQAHPSQMPDAVAP